MENASKALIIAGAILLSILIITLGIGVFNLAREAMDNINLDANEIQAYNAKFEDYEGTKVSGTRVRSLLEVIKQHNNANTGDPTLQVKVYLKKPSGGVENQPATNTVSVSSVNAIKADVKSGYTYGVEMGYHESSGHIVSVVLTPISPADFSTSLKHADGN